MRLSTRARYGTRVLVDITANQADAPLTLKDIANRQQVSLNYLKHLIAPLVAAGVVRTERGSGGGVRLAHAAQDITLSWVVRILEGSTAPVACVDAPSVCPRNAGCVTRGVWCKVKTAIDDVLDSVTIQDLVEQQRTAGQDGGSAPCTKMEQATVG